MAVGGNLSASALAGSGERPAFELARFVWTGSDRLEVAGRFFGVAESPEEGPELRLQSDDGVLRVPPVSGSVSGPPRNGQDWQADFLLEQPSRPLTRVDLVLGRDLVVELPEPREAPFDHPVLHLARSRSGDSAREDSAGQPAGDPVSLQAELLAAEAEVRELHAVVERTQRELARARDDLAGERERHAGEATRFREGLDKLRTTGEQALRDAVSGRHAALEKLRREHEAAVAAHEERASRAVAEAEGLRGQLVEAQIAADETRAEAERLRGRLAQIREALGDGS